MWLKDLGARVHGLSLPAPTNPSFHEVIKPHAFESETECDIRNLKPLAAAVKKTSPDFIFHLAAQPIVRRSYVEPLETFETNATGTANLLESVRQAELPCPVIVITSAATTATERTRCRASTSGSSEIKNRARQLRAAASAPVRRNRRCSRCTRSAGSARFRPGASAVRPTMES